MMSSFHGQNLHSFRNCTSVMEFISLKSGLRNSGIISFFDPRTNVRPLCTRPGWTRQPMAIWLLQLILPKPVIALVVRLGLLERGHPNEHEQQQLP